MAERAKSWDVIVVGAGISGLSSAKLLQEQGYKVLVLEAQDRVGGRTFTIQNSKVKYVDLGGAYIGPTQDRVFRMARELNIDTCMVYEKGDSAAFYKGRRYRHNTVFPPIGGFLTALDTNNLFREIDRMCKEIPLAAPWQAPHAKEWDRMSFQQWLDKTAWTEGGKYCGKDTVNLNICGEPEEMSLLWVLWYMKSAGGTFRINAVANGAQERKFVGGSQQLSERMAAKLGTDCVLLNRPVVKIEQGDRGVTVHDLNGQTYSASNVIIASPLPIQNKITYEPPLPPRRTQLIQRVPMGSVIKTFVYYEKPFWREKGFSGLSAIDDDEGLIGFSMDDTKPDGSHPALIAFILADRARTFCALTKDERKHRISRVYAKTFDSSEALKPIHYEEKNWADEQWSGGCYTVLLPPGFLTVFGEEIRKPIGRMYFAGTETATVWAGYMEGAIEAGERAAREIMCADGKISQSDIWKDEPEDHEVKARPIETTFWERNAPSVPGFLTLCGLTTLLGGAAVAGAAYIRYIKH